MTYAMKRTETASDAAYEVGRRYPPEAYNYEDDVTPNGVDQMRQKAAKVMATDEWDVVDGFGLAKRS